MSSPSASIAALPASGASLFDALPASIDDAASRGSDRRVHARLTPVDLQNPITARLKYGQAVTLVDLSAGGALVETSMFLRPDTDLVIELLDGRTRNVTDVVSRVLRSQVSGLQGGVKYRGACVFDRPFSHPALEVPLPPRPASADESLRLELALKTIVEGFFRRSTASAGAGRWRDGSALIDALTRLRAAAERRDTPTDRQIAQLLRTTIPALQRYDSVDSVMAQLRDALSLHLPLLSIRTHRSAYAPSLDRERVTLNMCTDAGDPPLAVTAEFAPGFGLDAAQFRLLKVSAYLVGLIDHWCPSSPVPATIGASPVRTIAASPPCTTTEQDLPAGWQRLVLRCLGGQLLRGYSNDFHPDRAHLYLCPTLTCSAAERLLVPTMRVKAVFFVKDLQGQPGRLDDNTFDHQPRGRKIEVTFQDGEMMIGSTLTYKPDGRGFFLQPANSQGNSLRIYVVNAAIRHMRFL
jgi:Family of unknown function (DUF6982)